LIIITKEEPKDGLKEFRGIQLLESEIKVIEELEKLISKKLRIVDFFEIGTIGAIVEKGQVIGLSLYRCGLSTIPEILGNLKSLQILLLRYNSGIILL